MDTFNSIDLRVGAHIQEELRAAEHDRLVRRALHNDQGVQQLRARMFSCSTWIQRLSDRMTGRRTDDPADAIAH